MPTDFIRMAYTYERKTKTYRARAYAGLHIGDHPDPLKTTMTVGLGDTRQEAEDDAVRYIREQFKRDGAACPEEVQSVGRKPAVICDGLLF